MLKPMKKMPEDIKLMDERIQKLKAKEASSHSQSAETDFSRASKIGFRIGTELISGVIIGGAIGYLLDKLFSLQPILLIVFLFLGGIAGFLNVYRFVKSLENKEE